MIPGGTWLPRQHDNSAPPPIPGHHPYARPLQTDWKRNDAGRWESGGTDPHRWEVVCQECGDSDGPIEVQSVAVKARRGPYASKHKAEHAATKHFNETKIRGMWPCHRGRWPRTVALREAKAVSL